MTAWRSIDGAPRNGSKIMAWMPATADGPGFAVKIEWTGEEGWRGTGPHALSGYEANALDAAGRGDRQSLAPLSV
jgi:hypothetical protein